MSSPVQPGTILSGKFRIEQVLGRGGMGVVVAAHHLKLDELVAIKFLLPEALANDEAVARFEREARATAKIKSEHIVRVSDVGALDNGSPYMVMEYLRGKDLGQILEQNGPLSLEDAADYLLQASEAIAEAHALGIVHRDIKPSNLFLTERADGSACIKVLDFGISKVTGAAGFGDQGMTSTGALMGSPLYASPEQLSSAKDVDARTDVWALGVILYELLTGTAPFIGETLPQLCSAVLTLPPRSLREARSDLPVGVEELVLACLEKDRGRRISTTAEFANRLVPFAPARSRLSAERIARLSRVPELSRVAPSLPPPSSNAGSELQAPVSGSGEDFTGVTPDASRGRRRRIIAWGSALVLVSATVALIGRLVDSTPPSSNATAASGTANVPPVELRAEPTTSPAPAEPVVVPVASPSAPIPRGKPKDKSMLHAVPSATPVSPRPTAPPTNGLGGRI